MTVAQLDRLGQINPDDCVKEDLVDIESISTDLIMPVRQRAEKYLEDIKNPYLFCCKGYTVSLRYSNEKTFWQVFQSYLSSLQAI